MAQATPTLTSTRQLNEALSKLMGRRIRVGYRFPKGDFGLTNPTGTANANVGRVHLERKLFDLILNKTPAKGLPLALGTLMHELGHHSPEALAYRPTPNATGGIDAGPARKAQEDIADAWGYANALRIAAALGYRPHQARAARSAFMKFRAAHPYREDGTT